MRLRRKALSERSMTLDKLIEIARASELAENQAADMEARSDVNFVEQQGRARTQPSASSETQAKCRSCGRQWPHNNGRQSCPAMGKTCRKCHGQNHFEAVCRSKAKAVKKPGAVSFRSRSNIHEVHTEQESDCEEYVYSISQFKAWYVNQPRFKVTVNGSEMTVIADSGASINIIDEHDFSKIKEDVSLSRTTAKILPYGSSSSLVVVGKFKALVEYRSRLVETDIFVVKGSGGSLLSWDTSTKLKLIDLVHEIQVTDSVSALKEEFSVLFQGLGKLKNFKVKLHIDDSVQACAQPHVEFRSTFGNRLMNN